MFPDNQVIKAFEFDAQDADGRKQAAQDLLNKTLKSVLSGFIDYPVRLHLIGLGQGGNVINELSDLLSKNFSIYCTRLVGQISFLRGHPGL